MEMTGRSERTVRKYFSQSRDDYENSNGSSSSGLRTTKPGAEMATSSRQNGLFVSRSRCPVSPLCCLRYASKQPVTTSKQFFPNLTKPSTPGGIFSPFPRIRACVWIGEGHSGTNKSTNPPSHQRPSGNLKTSSLRLATFTMKTSQDRLVFYCSRFTIFILPLF